MAIEGDGGADTGAVGTAADLFGGAATGGGDGNAAPADKAGESGGGDAGGTPDWFERVSAEAGEGETSSNRDWLASKGFKDLDGLVKSARFAEKAIHDKGRIAVPGEGAKPEEVAAFRTAIGVPDKPDGYEVKAPEGIPLNEPLIAKLRDSALKHGAPKGAFEGLVGDFIQSQLDEAAQEKKHQDELTEQWRARQGGKISEAEAHINVAARALQLSSKDLLGLRSGLGADRALDLLTKLGSGMAEDVLQTGGKGSFGVSGAEAKTQMDAMSADPEIRAKIKVVGSPERVRWDRLNAAHAEHEARKQAAA